MCGCEGTGPGQYEAVRSECAKFWFLQSSPSSEDILWVISRVYDFKTQLYELTTGCLHESGLNSDRPAFNCAFRLFR